MKTRAWDIVNELRDQLLDANRKLAGKGYFPIVELDPTIELFVRLLDGRPHFLEISREIERLKALKGKHE